MKKAGKVLVLVLAVYLASAATGWTAEKVILNNGNELTGDIIEETNDYVILSTMEGKGRTKIFRSDIADIRKIRPVERAPAEQKREPVKKETAPPDTGKKIVSAPGGTNPVFVYFFLAIAAFILINGILFFIIQQRPAGIKVIVLLGGAVYVFLFLLGLMFWPFFTQRGSGITGGMELFPFLWMVFIFFVIPAVSLCMLFYLFHLRKWARIAFSALLVIGLLVSAAMFSMQNKFDFYRSLLEAGNMGIALPETGQMQNKSGNPFALIPSVVWTLALLVYLNLPRTKKHFDEPLPVSKIGMCAVFAAAVVFFLIGDVVYRQMFVRMSGNPDFFTPPVKMLGALDRPASVARYEAKTAGKVRLFLPSGMSVFSKSDSGEQVVFMDKKKARFFMINVLAEKEFRLLSLLAYARWNPLLLFLKVISVPRPPFPKDGRLIFSREIVFPQGRLFLKCFEGKDGRVYDFVLWNKDKCFSGQIGGDRNDDFTGERIALEMISLIE